MRKLARTIAGILGFVVGLVAGFIAVIAWLGERGQIPLPSTRRFFQEGRRRGQSLLEQIHGYAYVGFPYHYIGWGLNGPPKVLAAPLKWLTDHLSLSSGQESGTIADNYHGKVVPLDEATRLVSINQDISLTVPEQIVPFQRARDIIMQEPDHIVALDCPCRMSREDPCLPLDVCLIVGEPFASFVLEHHPDRSRRVSPAEAAQILIEEDERGHVHHAFFKEAMLERFYAICNCCSCCCGAMQMHRNDTPMLISSGYVAQVDPDLCHACGDCGAFCQFHALSTVDGRTVVDVSICMGCGICLTKCEQGALSLRLDPAKGVPLHIQELMQLEVSS